MSCVCVYACVCVCVCMERERERLSNDQVWKFSDLFISEKKHIAVLEKKVNK